MTMNPPLVGILDMDPEKSLKSQLKKEDEDEDEDDGPPLKDDPKYIKVRYESTLIIT